jgi:hypothetical protein
MRTVSVMGFDNVVGYRVMQEALDAGRVALVLADGSEVSRAYGEPYYLVDIEDRLYAARVPLIIRRFAQ